MAFWGGMRRAAKEAGLWLGVTCTAIASFFFFEDAYRALEHTWPRLQASFAANERIELADVAPATTVNETGSIPKQALKTLSLIHI